MLTLFSPLARMPKIKALRSNLKKLEYDKMDIDSSLEVMKIKLDFAANRYQDYLYEGNKANVEEIK